MRMLTWKELKAQKTSWSFLILSGIGLLAGLPVVRQSFVNPDRPDASMAIALAVWFIGHCLIIAAALYRIKRPRYWFFYDTDNRTVHYYEKRIEVAAAPLTTLRQGPLRS